VPYVTGRAQNSTGFPVVNIEFALQRGRQEPLICNAQSGSFQSHQCRGSFAGGGDSRSVSRAGDHVVTEYELVPLFDRKPDGAANGIILFDIYFRGAFVGCARTWARARAYVDFLQSNDNLFLKASRSPFGMMNFYKNRLRRITPPTSSIGRIRLIVHWSSATTATPTPPRACRKAAGNSPKRGTFSIS
jgi:hypothetical protein